jgi:hypothetical protein
MRDGNSPGFHLGYDEIACSGQLAEEQGRGKKDALCLMIISLQAAVLRLHFR